MPAAQAMLASRTLTKPSSGQNVDYRLEHFKLDPVAKRLASIDIAEAIIDDAFTFTIEGEPFLELTVQDSGLTLLRSAMLTGWAWGKNADHRDEARWMLDGQVVDATLDDWELRLVKVEKLSVDQLKLTFADLAVAKLKAHEGARKVYRDQFNRAEFVHALNRAADVDDHIPELNADQPIAQARTGQTSSTKSKRERGLDRSADLTVNGRRLGPGQIKNAEIALDTASEEKAPEKAILALLEACIVEPAGVVNGRQYHPFDNPPGGDASSEGILQLLASTAKGLHVDPRDVEKVCRLFLTRGFWGRGGAIHLARTQPGLSSGEIAQQCQGSAFGSRYGEHLRDAQKVLAAYKPGFDSTGTLTTTVEKPFAFARGKDENSWDAELRLAGDVQWRAFARKNVVWYASEAYLFDQHPVLTLREGEDGVEEITFGIDLEARDLVNDLTVTARAAMWTAQPGMTARVPAGTQGPADGRWLVHQIEGKLSDDLVTVTLNKSLPKKLEPAADTVDLSIATSAGSLKAQGGPLAKAYALYLAAKQISKAGGTYVYGGGHGTPLSRLRSGQGLDCSSSTSLALYRAGLFDEKLAWVSGQFAATYGQAGRGKYITVWAHSGHVFIQIDLPGKPSLRFDTSQHPGSGPRLVKWGGRTTAGFTPRHPRGL